MGIYSKQSPSARLLKVLEREQDTLTAGALDDIADALADKEEALQDFYAARDGRSEVELRNLRIKFEQNQQLYRAVQAGFQAANERLMGFLNPDLHLKTYNRSGSMGCFNRGLTDRKF
ncbi:hypothetical protein [Litoreibacter albidus]|uniref:FlgN protein n=1 Tax=Litoreibacter albidus TaxID=670155 RepID=A0A1H2VKB8_9RHOB|nr:hypothetical protein [Litoreibacter albidus]SDW68329.1 hypothetical protein SAMN04488001_1540 [Litoreibacter albidus]